MGRRRGPNPIFSVGAAMRPSRIPANLDERWRVILAAKVARPTLTGLDMPNRATDISVVAGHFAKVRTGVSDDECYPLPDPSQDRADCGPARNPGSDPARG